MANESRWLKHDEFISRISCMSQGELDDIARQAAHLFYRMSRDEPGEEIRSDLDTATPEIFYLFLRMTARDRISNGYGNKEVMRGIAVYVAKEFAGYDLTPEDWPLLAQSTTPEEDT